MATSAPSTPKRIAVIGSGVAGLGAAWLLSREPEKYQITVYEADDYFGGHTHTVDVPSLGDPEKKVGVDTGFIVCNPVTYPNFLNFLREVEVPLQRSDMSFSVSRNDGQLEWSGDTLNTVFAQRKNLLPLGHGHEEPFGMYGMLWQIIRFHKQAAQIAEEADALQFDEEGKLREFGPGDKKVHPFASMTLGEFFTKFGYSRFFYENYVLPMTAAIWSTPANMTFDKFPLLTLVRFMRNHIMLQIGGRPKWRTVLNGSREYVTKVLSAIPDARLATRVTSLKREVLPSGGFKVHIEDNQGSKDTYDHVILATHSDQALAILGEDATEDEKKILGSIKFVNNRAVLHRDPKVCPTDTPEDSCLPFNQLMPKARLAWASWNYLTRVDEESRSQTMCLTYWMNRLQPYIDVETYGEVFVTMNPLTEPDSDKVLGEYQYTHPLYSPETIAAQDNLNSIQNRRGISFAGAWTNYGFHEDGLTSGLQVAESLGAKTCPFPVMLNGGYPTHRLPAPRIDLFNPSAPMETADQQAARRPAPLYARKDVWERAVKEAAAVPGKKGANSGVVGVAGLVGAVAAVLAVGLAFAVAKQGGPTATPEVVAA
ncbi:hypothetical protein HDU96_009692 [Phlyctochytrium bullatum]|nr:hypothetical protein HDU96_009692 [Phlyctochytrium bullatum]